MTGDRTTERCKVADRYQNLSRSVRAREAKRRAATRKQASLEMSNRRDEVDQSPGMEGRR